ncbi:MAG TPA: toxin TcdB middle/N-terminal domain-containing protein [bacterium]
MRRRVLSALAGALLVLAAVPASAADKNGVSPNAISLPSGPGSIEGLGESFQPQLNTGSARYAVKIPLPRLHNTPELKLQYESGFGDGPAGIGWTYGPGSIARQVDKGLPRYVDGPNGVDDDADGQIDEADESDTYVGPDGEELVPVGDGVYRARIEGSFARYRRLVSGWEVTLRNGTRVDFGTSAAGQVADASGAKVFRWLPERSTDTNGNVVQYAWASYPGSESQKYLRQIRYGPGAPPWGAFYFASFSYEDKPDWRADYRAGFLVRTAKRLAKIEVGIQGTLPAQCAVGDWNADGTQDALIARYAIAYDGAHPDRSFLAKITRYGADGVNWLPPISFAYAAHDPPPVVSASSVRVDTDNAPLSVMDSLLAELVDLNRDGLPDVLQTDREGGFHRAFLNLGADALSGGRVRWADGRYLASEDGVAPQLQLAEARVHLADIDGDGIADLVQTSAAGEVSWFPNDGAVGWKARRRMSLAGAAPPAPFTTADAAVADLDFDKRMDVVLSTENGYAVWFNRGDDRYSEEVRTPGARHEGAVLRFSTPGVRLADMNGDRLADVVRVTPTCLVVAAGMGHGRFAPAVEVPIAGATLTDGADGQIARARLEDVNGDGLADLVVERAEVGELHCWLNRGTDTLGPRIVVTGMPVVYAAGTAVRWADLNGNGTTDLVYADSTADERLRMVDVGVLLGGSSHPNLLERVDNGLGALTAIEWRASTELLVADGRTAHPWASTIPFPVQVVVAIETTTGMDLDDAPGPDRMRRELAYRDGFYEDRERAFRGFGEVRVTEPGDAAAPTRVDVSGFFTGGPDGVDDDGDGLIDEIGAGNHREEEALRGKLRFAEARSATDVLYQREENDWRVRTLLTAMDGSEVRLACRTRNDALQYEGTAAPETVRTTWAYDDFGNPTEERRQGALSLEGDEAFILTEYVNDTGRWIIGLPSRRRVTDAAGTDIAETFNYYDGPDYAGLPFGRVEKGNLTRTLGKVRTGEFVALTRNARDAWGNVVGSLDPNGGQRTVTWDSLLHAFPVREQIQVGGGNPDLAIAAEYHAAFGALTASEDFNRNRSEFRYDAFGRLVTIVKPGDSAESPSIEFHFRMAAPRLPDAAGGLTYDYDAAGGLTLTAGPAGPSSVTTGARERSGEAGTWDVVKYTDGLGRPLATVSEAEAGWTVSRAVTFNARGTPRFAFQPYAAGAAAFGRPSAVLAATEVRLDAMGREVLRLNPPDALGVVSDVATSWFPLGRTRTDEEERSRTFLLDGLGRLIEIRAHHGAETYTTRNAYDPLGRVVQATDALANVRTFAYDGLGRRTLIEDPDRGRVETSYDAAGNVVRRVDNKGQGVLYAYDAANRLLAEYRRDGSGPGPAVEYHYDAPAADFPAAANLAGRLAWVTDPSGAQHFSYDSRGNRTEALRRVRDRGTSRDFLRQWEYDALDRVTAETFPDGDRATYEFNGGGLLERIPGVVSGIDYLPSGAVGRIAYANGLASDYGYDPRNRLTGLTTAPAAGSAIQDLAYALDGVGNVRAVADGRPGVTGSPSDGTQSYQYDDLHRLVRSEGPHGAVIFEYDAIGNLTSTSSPALPDPLHIADDLVNLGALAYGGAGGTSGRGLRAPGAAPGPHAITATASGLAYAYDDNGNMTSRGAGDAYEWDFNDRMVRAQVGTAVARFVYDWAGQRVIKELSAGAAVSSAWYIDRGYELRDGRPVKSIFAGDRRVAQIEGRLAPGAESGQQTLRFGKGWNFFSLEVEPADPALAAVLAPIAGKYDGVWTFDAAAQAYVAPAELHGRRGYLIRATETVELTVTGTKSTAAIALSPGWNLVACPAENALPAADAFAAAAPDAVWAYETGAATWQAWSAAPPQGIAPLTLVEPGRAYWVHAGSAASLALAARPTRIFFYHPDHIGSTAVVTDLSGAVVARNEYYPYGRTRYTERAGFDPAYAFTGAELDAETGLVALGARSLDPVTGRFVSVDPAFADAYAYGWNNPLRFTDPRGTYGNQDLAREIGAPEPTDYTPGEETKDLVGKVKETGGKLADISIQDIVNFLIKELVKVAVDALMSQIGSPVLKQLVTNLLESDILDLDYALNEVWGAIDSEVMTKPIIQQVREAGGEGMESFLSDAGGVLKDVGGVAESAAGIAGNALEFVGSIPGGTYLTNPIAEKMRSLETDITDKIEKPLDEVSSLADRMSAATVAHTGPNYFWQGDETAKLVVVMGLAKGMDQFIPQPW